MLGLPEKKDGLLLVEDDESEELLRYTISFIDPSIMKQFAILNLKSTGPIISSLKKVPPELGFKIAGIFDADMRNSPDLNGTKHWPHYFLPGDGPPEKLFMYIANTWHESLAKHLPRDHQELRTILAEVESQEHHNWLDNLSQKLTIDKSLLIYILLKTWADTDEGREQLTEFVELIKEYSKQ
jgi:hypothetical protein